MQTWLGIVYFYLLSPAAPSSRAELDGWTNDLVVVTYRRVANYHKLSSLNNRHLLSHSFCALGIGPRLSWPLLQAEVQILTGAVVSPETRVWGCKGIRSQVHQDIGRTDFLVALVGHTDGSFFNDGEKRKRLEWVCGQDGVLRHNVIMGVTSPPLDHHEGDGWINNSSSKF